MSEVVNYAKIALGEREQYFILLFGQHNYSAYELYMKMKNQTLMKPMAYKNVHDRVKRLVTLGLLEKLEGTFKRKAIKYRLTSRGLFEYLSLGNIAHAFVWLDYRENIIIQTLLFDYFEIATVRKMTFPGYYTAANLFGNYLKKCCDAILLNLNQFRETTRSYAENKTFQQHRERVIEDHLDTVIRNELNDFILTIVIATGAEQSASEDGDHLLPLFELKHDDKFMGTLHEMKRDFDNGYRQFDDGYDEVAV